MKSEISCNILPESLLPHNVVSHLSDDLSCAKMDLCL